MSKQLNQHREKNVYLIHTMNRNTEQMFQTCTPLQVIQVGHVCLTIYQLSV